MNIKIDGQNIEVVSSDKNIVDVADRVKIGIAAPCYRAQQSKGCCNSCIVEVNGEQKFACATAPEEGMNIILNRDDLKDIRKKRLLEYQKAIKDRNSCNCDCSGTRDCS